MCNLLYSFNFFLCDVHLLICSWPTTIFIVKNSSDTITSLRPDPHFFLLIPFYISHLKINLLSLLWMKLISIQTHFSFSDLFQLPCADWAFHFPFLLKTLLCFKVALTLNFGIKHSLVSICLHPNPSLVHNSYLKQTNW